MNKQKLPKGWKKVKFQEIADFTAGFAFNSSKYKNLGIKIIRIQNLGNNKDEKFVYWDGEYNKKYLIKKGDLLLSLSGTIPVSFKIHTWKGENALLNQRILRINLNEKLADKKYIEYAVFKGLINVYSKATSTTGIANVSMGVIKSLKIPLPPLVTQKAIVSILEKAEKAKEWRKKADKLTDDYLKSVFYEMFLKKYDVVFDNNLIIDLEERREGWKDIKELQEYEKKGKLKIHIPVIVGSEKKIGKGKSDPSNYKDVKNLIEKLGFKEFEELKPLGIWNMTFWGYCLWASKEMGNLLEEIYKILFPNKSFDYLDYCMKKGALPNHEVNHKWKKDIIDAIILWTCVYYKKNYLITRDSHFLKKKDRIKQKYGIEILKPDELIKKIKERDFEIVKIKDVIKKTGNDNPSRDYPDKEFEYIDISSIDNNKGKIISSKRILGKDAPSRAKQKVKFNDLIISTVRPNLNSVVLIPKNLDNQICSTGFCVLRTNIEKVSPEFLFHVSRSSKFIGSMVKIAKGASYPAVSDRDIKNYEIPLPPISLQNKFASIVKEVEKLKEKQKKSREEIDNLFNALMQKAFKGELVR